MTAKSHLWRHLLISVAIIGLWGLFTAVYIAISIYKPTALYDYGAYYQAAERFNHGQALYIGYEAPRTYLYPPLLAQLLIPIAASLTFMETAIIWISLNIFCLIVATWLMALQTPQSWKRYIVMILPLLFIPSIDTFTNGQVVPIMLLMMVGAWVAHKHNHPIFTGGFLAIATWLKLYPVLLIVYFVLRRDWKVMIAAFIAGIILLLFQISVSGMETMVTFFTETLANLASSGQSFHLFHNHTIFGFVHRLITNNPTSAKIIQWSITGLLIVIMIRVGNHQWHTPLKNLPDHVFDLEYGMTMIFMLIMGSTLISASILPILLPVTIALIYAQTLKHYIVVFTAFVVISLTSAFLTDELVINLHPLFQSYGFFALLTLWGFLIYLRGKYSHDFSTTATEI